MSRVSERIARSCSCLKASCIKCKNNRAERLRALADAFGSVTSPSESEASRASWEESTSSTDDSSDSTIPSDAIIALDDSVSDDGAPSDSAPDDGAPSKSSGSSDSAPSKSSGSSADEFVHVVTPAPPTPNTPGSLTVCLSYLNKDFTAVIRLGDAWPGSDKDSVADIKDSVVRAAKRHFAGLVEEERREHKRARRNRG